MENNNKRIQVDFSKRKVALDYHLQDMSVPNSVHIEGHSSISFGLNRAGWRTLEKSAQYSLIKAALKKEYGRIRLLEIIGIKQDIECSDSQDEVSLRLEGTAVYS